MKEILVDGEVLKINRFGIMWGDHIVSWRWVSDRN